MVSFGITAIPGLVLGIYAARSIARSQGEQRGLVWAVLGIVVSGFMLIPLLSLIIIVLGK